MKEIIKFIKNDAFIVILFIIFWTLFLTIPNIKKIETELISVTNSTNDIKANAALSLYEDTQLKNNLVLITKELVSIKEELKNLKKGNK